MSDNESKFSPEQGTPSRDVSQEFMTMRGVEFFDFIDTLKSVSELSINIDWPGESKAQVVKAFLEASKPRGQKRTAAIRATDEQYGQAANVFASGVKRIKV